MDHVRDYARFQKLIRRLCETLSKPCTDELLETWWKSLRGAKFEELESRVDTFLAKADDTTRFPRPAQLRPANAPLTVQDDSGQDWIRGYWRSCIVANIARMSGHTAASLEPVIVGNRESIGEPMRTLLDALDTWEKREGQRTHLMRDMCEKQCVSIAADIVDHIQPGYALPALVGDPARRYMNWHPRPHPLPGSSELGKRGDTIDQRPTPPQAAARTTAELLNQLRKHTKLDGNGSHA